MGPTRIPGHPPEADWKVFRELREVALERFCSRVLESLYPFRHDESRTYHERYLALFRWLGARNVEMAGAFDGARRSRMLPQLAAIVSLELLEPDELARFSDETRETVESLAAAMKG